MAALSSAQISLLAVVCFLSGAAGNFAVSMLGAPKASDPMPVARQAEPASDSQTPELLQEIRALRQELARDPNHRQLVDPKLQSVPEPGPEDASLRERLTAIESRLATSGVALDQAARRPPLRSIAYLARIVANWEVDLESGRAAERRLDEEHQLWTTSQVIEQYGMPSAIKGESGELQFVYLLPDDKWMITFCFASGVVCNVRFMT